MTFKEWNISNSSICKNLYAMQIELYASRVWVCVILEHEYYCPETLHHPSFHPLNPKDPAIACNVYHQRI